MYAPIAILVVWPNFAHVSCVGRQSGASSGSIKEKTRSTQVGNALMDLIQFALHAALLLWAPRFLVVRSFPIILTLLILSSKSIPCALTLTQRGDVALMIAYQRYRVRQIYDIEGHAANDLLAACFCPPCTNARNDREIRVREGDKKLRRKWENKANYRAAVNAGAIQTINVPPARIEPMRYVSPRVTSERTSNRSFVPPSNAQDSLHEVQNTEPQRPRLAFLRPQKYRNVNSQNHTHQKNEAESHISEANGYLYGNGESTLQGLHVPTGNIELEKPIELASLRASFTVAAEARQANLPSEPHDPAVRRAELETGNTDALDRTSIEHSPIDSEGGDTATSLCGKRSNIGAAGGHELSYVHDFSDCPVNKSVLIYYEREENKSKKPILHDGAGSKLLSNNPYQRLVGDQQVNSPSSGRDEASNRHAELSGREASSGPTAGPRTASYWKGSERHRESSRKKASTRSVDDFVPEFLPFDLETRVDKKATSF